MKKIQTFITHTIYSYIKALYCEEHSCTKNTKTRTSIDTPDMSSTTALFASAERSIFATLSPGWDHTTGITHGWPLTSLQAALATVTGYVAVVFLGYVYMRSRKEIINLRPLQYVYNLVQVGLCSYLVIGSLTNAKKLGYAPVCNTFDYQNPSGDLPWLLYIFYLSKALDFFDTCFIVFHKKDDQLSFLHLYHHVTIFLTYWVNANIFYSGDIYYTIVANGAVHTVMYAYYFLSMLNTYDRNDPEAKQPYPVLGKLLKASKPFITATQLFQFVTMMSQAIYILQNDCGSPRVWVMYYLVYIMSLFILFTKFAIKNYCSSESSKGKKKRN